MRSYILHRLITIGLFAVLLVFIWVLETGLDAWWWLLAVVTCFGYSHYGIGGYYQIRHMCRDQYRKRLLYAGGVVVILSVLAVIAFYLTDLFYLLSFFVIVYFLWHGYENELTLFERQTALRARRDTVGALVLTTLALAFFGVGHASWYFTTWYEFIAVTPVVYELLPGGTWLPELAFWAGVISSVFALMLGGHALVRSTHKLFHALFLLGIGLALSVSLFLFPIHYVVILGGLLFYHFGVWFLFYEERFRIRSWTAWREYIILHGVLALPLVGLLFEPMKDTLITVLFNSYTFLTLTVIHISLSFLNEEKVRAYLTR